MLAPRRPHKWSAIVYDDFNVQILFVMVLQLGYPYQLCWIIYEIYNTLTYLMKKYFKSGNLKDMLYSNNSSTHPYLLHKYLIIDAIVFNSKFIVWNCSIQSHGFQNNCGRNDAFLDGKIVHP